VPQGKNVAIVLSGEIDESSDFSPINVDQYEGVVIDFKDVNGINSCGVREWINFLKNLDGKSVSYVNCPKIIVDQMNMINNFIGLEFKIVSIELPYYCDECDEEVQKLYPLADLVEGGELTIPECKCETCDGEMEFDEIPEQYFSFLNQGN
jgi:hypothetical protein